VRIAVKPLSMSCTFHLIILIYPKNLFIGRESGRRVCRGCLRTKPWYCDLRYGDGP